MANGAVVALDIGILLRLSRLDIAQGNALLLGPFHQFAADIFRAIVHSDGQRPAAPFDDLVQAADDALGRKREVHFDAQSLAVEVVQNVQQPELSAIIQTVRHEVHGPDYVRCFRHGQCIRLVTLQPLAWPNPEVELPPKDRTCSGLRLRADELAR